MSDLNAPYMARSTSDAGNAALRELQSLDFEDKAAPVPQANAKPPPQPGLGGKIMSVAKDVGSGIVESPVQAFGGVLDAVGNTAKGLDHLGNWFESHVTGYDDPNFNGYLDAIHAVGNLSGAVHQPKSVTGGFVREGAKFLAGFVPALRVAKLAGLGNVAGSIAAGGVAGATVQDPEQPNLSATINSHVQVPEALKPAVDMLATNPNDPEIVNRARNAVENLGFGALTEGTFRGVRAVAAARRAASGVAPEATTDPLAAMKAQYGEVKPEDLAPLGDPAKPAVSVSKKMADATKATDGRVSLPTDDGGQVYINFARINEPEDVKAAMDKMASALKSNIDEARRGVQSNEETARLADDLGMNVDDLLQRRKGQPFSAEEALAARKLWAASGQKLVDLAEKAADPNAGNVDRVLFRKMMATHYAVQSEVIAARTETARALQSWAIPAGGGVEQARAIQMMLDESGGEGVTTALARRIASLKNTGAGQDALNAMVRKGWGATTMDAVREAYVNGLLWSPSTHIVNTMSNGVVAGQQIYERAAAAGFSALRNDPNGVQFAEVPAMMYGLTSGLRDAFRLGARAIATGERGGQQLGAKVELPNPNAISAQSFRLDPENGLGKAVDYIGFANNIPGRLLMAEDEFFKSIGYRMELHAQAARTASQEGLTGPDLANRVAEITANPPENIRISAADAALYSTFQSVPGKAVRAAMNLREASRVGWLLVPFIKTPANILAYTFERTPAAPLVARWRADVAAGGARKDLALARMATGSAAMMVALDLADSGLLTGAGPQDKGDREALARSGWQPYSIRTGNKFVSYSRTDPLAMPLAFAATLSEKFKQSATSKDDLPEWEEALAAGATTLAQTVTNKTWFTGFTNLITAIQEAPQGLTSVENLVNRQAGSMVPFSSLLNTAKRATDPEARQVMSPYDAILAKLPILSQTLPPQRDLWGFPLKPDETFGRTYDVLSPLAVKSRKDSPIDAEMARIQGGVERIDTRGPFQGVPMNFRDYPHVYDRYTALAGHELKHPAWGVGAKDFLDQMVTGKGPISPIYGLMSDEGKGHIISQTVREYRELAQREIMQNPKTAEERRFVDEVRQKQDVMQRAKMMVGAQ